MNDTPARFDAPSQNLRRLAIALGALEIAIILITVVLIVAGRSAAFSGWGFRGFPSLFAFMFSATGLVILLNHPRHAVGWVFSLLGFFAAFQALLFEYGTYALILHPGALPGGVLVAWILNWYWILLLVFLGLMLILFPNGNLPSPRWRLPIVLVILCALVGISLGAVVPGKLDSSFAFLENPYGLPQLSGTIAEILNSMLLFLILPIFLVSLAGLIAKMRYSQGRERAQFKWFAFGGGLLLVTFPAASSDSWLVQLIFIAAMFFMPVAMSIAILRYRLYDIDLIIRRTLVYLVMSALLGLIYFGGIVILQSFFVSFTGQTQSQLITAISTLLIAALFFPVRNRVQTFIDQRFYRSSYDAAKTLATFAASARDEVELESLTARLVQVVDDTMQPEHMGLLLKNLEHTPQRNTP